MLQCDDVSARQENARSVCDVVCALQKNERSVCDVVCAVQENGRSVCGVVCAVQENGSSISDVVCAVQENGRSVCDDVCAVQENGSSVSDVVCAVQENGRSVCDVVCAVQENGTCSMMVAMASPGLHGLAKFKRVKRPRLLKLPRLTDPVPCIFSTSPGSNQSEFYFPISQQSYRVDIDLRDYSVAGHSIPQRGSWLVLVRGREVFLFNGRKRISLRNLPAALPEPTGHLMASFTGDPERGCEVLLVEITENLCTSNVYDPGFGWIASVRDMGHEQQPEGQVTTRTGFSWVDTFASMMYSFENFWDNPDAEPDAVALDENIVGQAEMVCSVLREEQLYALVVLMDEQIAVYRVGAVSEINGQRTRQLNLLHLVPGETIFASSTGPGLIRSVRNRLVPSQRIYLGSLNCDCMDINVGVDPVDAQIIKPCYHPMDDNCHCHSCVLLLDEYSLFRN